MRLTPEQSGEYFEDDDPLELEEDSDDFDDGPEDTEDDQDDEE